MDTSTFSDDDYIKKIKLLEKLIIKEPNHAKVSELSRLIDLKKMGSKKNDVNINPKNTKSNEISAMDILQSLDLKLWNILQKSKKVPVHVKKSTNVVIVDNETVDVDDIPENDSGDEAADKETNEDSDSSKSSEDSQEFEDEDESDDSDSDDSGDFSD